MLLGQMVQQALITKPDWPVLVSAAHMVEERIRPFKLSCVRAELSNGHLPALERFATAAADSV